MKRLIILLAFVQGCSVVSHHELEHRCSANCNEVIENLQNLKFDSQAIISKLFKREEIEVCDEPIGTFSCAAEDNK